MSKLVFGCWQIGKWHFTDVSDSESEKALLKAYELGVRKFDTAPVYGFGHSEELLGKVFKSKRNNIFIMTKFGLNFDTKENVLFFKTKFQGENIEVYRNSSKDFIIQDCENSLRRLKTDYIDLYQLHWRDDTCSLLEVADCLENLKKQGKVKNWGVCNLNTGDLDLLTKNSFKPYSLQFKYSLLNRKSEKSVIPYCKKHKIKLFGYSPFEQGLLSGAINEKRKFNKEDGRNWIKEERIKNVQNVLNMLEKFLIKYNTSLPKLILNVTLKVSKCDYLIAGIRTEKQLIENFDFENVQIENKDIETIVNILKVL